MNKNIKNKKTGLSKSSEKKSDMLIQVNELMEKLENDYGPLMLEELQQRLVKTIEEFQTDVNSVLSDAFDKHRVKYESIDNKLSPDAESKGDVPSFISEYEQKKINSVLDGELAVSCNLKSAICRVESQWKGLAELSWDIKVVLMY